LGVRGNETRSRNNTNGTKTTPSKKMYKKNVPKKMYKNKSVNLTIESTERRSSG
jgi:hypothetical protein